MHPCKSKIPGTNEQEENEVYRLLIVNYKDHIADGIFSYINGQRRMELDICMAYSSAEALQWLNKMRIDIVLSDLHMPGMNGYRMLETIKTGWPLCEVIFLTKYQSFENINRALSYDGVQFLLKADGYDKMLWAVEKAISQIEKNTKSEDTQANQKLGIMIPLLQKEYLLELIRSEPTDDNERKSKFMEYGIRLNARMPVLPLIGKIDKYPSDITHNKKTKLLHTIKQFAERHFSKHVTISAVIHEQHIFWMVQPLESGYDNHCDLQEDSQWENTLVFVKGISKIIQSSCKINLHIPFSIIIGNEPVQWNQIHDVYGSLKYMLDYHIVNGTILLLTEQDLNMMPKVDIYDQLRKLETLKTFLHNGLQNEFFQMYDTLVQDVGETENMCSFSYIELYYSWALFMLSYVNQNEMIDKIASKIDLQKLTRVDEYNSWPEAFGYLKEFAGIVLEHQRNEQKSKEMIPIATIQRYIQDHLNEDLSLIRLADIVHLNPSYLSRMYKKATGFNLNHYINIIRLNKAKELLKNSNLKIHEIASHVGYLSGSYFTQFFKRETKISPQHYRDTADWPKEASGASYLQN